MPSTTSLSTKTTKESGNFDKAHTQYLQAARKINEAKLPMARALVIGMIALLMATIMAQV